MLSEIEQTERTIPMISLICRILNKIETNQNGKRLMNKRNKMSGCWELLFGGGVESRTR